MIRTTILQQQTLASDAADTHRTLSFAQFDPALGTLVDIRLTVLGDMTTTASIENLGAAAAKADLRLPSQIEVFTPANVLVLSASVQPTAQVNLGAFDGTKDFAGSSGTILAGVTDVGSSQLVYVPGVADLNAFSGTGTIDLSVVGVTSSNVLSGGNLRADFRSNVGAVLGIQYDYEDLGSVAGGGGGTGGSVNTIVFNNTFPVLSTFTNAVTAAPQTFTITDSTTDWTRTVDLVRFDGSLGTLLAINVGLITDLQGGIAAENEAPVPVGVTVTQQATVTLAFPGTVAVTASPFLSGTLTLGAFDGLTDFAGTSGGSLTGLHDSAGGTVTTSVTDASALAALTGSGAQTLSLSAFGQSLVNGGGSMLTEVSQSAGASLSISYVYEPSIACFASGTRIATPTGAVAVEALRVGDSVCLHRGGTAPIIWIGRRSVICARHSNPDSVRPVRVAAHAFGPKQPQRDLLLSPDHAVFVDNVLIPAYVLVDGDAIAQIPVHAVTYFHIELARHDVILAEGLPVETFLDVGNRARFDDNSQVTRLQSASPSLVWEAQGCAPLVVTGPIVTAVRARLSAAHQVAA